MWKSGKLWKSWKDGKNVKERLCVFDPNRVWAKVSDGEGKENSDYTQLLVLGLKQGEMGWKSEIFS